MDRKEIIKQVSNDLNIPLEVVNKAYESFWGFIRSKIVELPLKKDLSEEEFSRLRTNFNIPSLGKLNCTYKRMIGIKQKYKSNNNGRV